MVDQTHAIPRSASLCRRRQYEARRQPALGDEGYFGIGRQLSHAAHARHILGQIEIVYRFGNDRRQIKRGCIGAQQIALARNDQERSSDPPGCSHIHASRAKKAFARAKQVLKRAGFEAN